MQIPLCVNCHAYLPGLDVGSDKCGHLDCGRTDPVRGIFKMGYCDLARGLVGPCGPEGKLFSSKIKPNLLGDSHE
jgi:hypothetical protein